MTDIRLNHVYTISATLVARSGLHIGAGKDDIEIGGIDNPVIKHPFTQEPYIPGSSIKGKLRSLLEWALGCIEEDGSVWGSRRRGEYDNSDVILRIFGTANSGEGKWQGGPTRLIVRDAPLDPEWARKIRDQGLALTEEKQEVSIDRIQGKAKDGGIRRTERVPAEARFSLDMRFKVFDLDGDGGERDKECLNYLVEALKLLENDALGGSGSRGYGRMQVENLAVDGRSVQAQFDSIQSVDKARPQLSLV
jgi:CRISPR-associated protein Csm3